MLITFISSPAYPFRYRQMEIKPQFSAGQIYDDNVTYVRQDPVKDSITNLRGGLSLGLESRSLSFELSGGLTHQIYSQNRHLNNTAQDAGLTIDQELSSRDRLRLKDSFSHTYEPRSFEEAFGRASGRFSYSRNDFDLSYIREIGGSLSVEGRYGNQINEGEESAVIDSHLNSAGATVSYAHNAYFTFLLAYDYAKRDLRAGRSSSLHKVSTGFRQYFTPRFYLDGRIGLNTVRTYGGGAHTSPPLYAALTHELNERTRFSLSYEKEYEMNPYMEEFFDQWKTSGFVERQVSQRLGVAANGFYGKGEYASFGIRDVLWGAGAGLNFELRENLKLNLALSHSDMTSSEPARGHLKNRAYAGLAMEF